MRRLLATFLGFALFMVGGGLMTNPSPVAAQMPLDCTAARNHLQTTLTVWDEGLDSWVQQTFSCLAYGGNTNDFRWVKHGAPLWNFETQDKPDSVAPTGQFTQAQLPGGGSIAHRPIFRVISTSSFETPAQNARGEAIWSNERARVIQRYLSQYVSIRDACEDLNSNTQAKNVPTAPNDGTRVTSQSLVRVGNAWYQIPHSGDRQAFLRESEHDPPPRPMSVVWGTIVPPTADVPGAPGLGLPTLPGTPGLQIRECQ